MNLSHVTLRVIQLMLFPEISRHSPVFARRMPLDNGHRQIGFYDRPTSIYRLLPDFFPPVRVLLSSVRKNKMKNGVNKIDQRVCVRVPTRLCLLWIRDYGKQEISDGFRVSLRG